MLIIGHKHIEMFQRYANLRADELVMRLPKGGNLSPLSATVAVHSALKPFVPTEPDHPLAEFAKR